MAPLDKQPAPIQALVVDDESLARRNLTVLLRRDPDIGSVAECGSGLEAIEEIRKSKPDLVFLDVQMPECGGFDVLELLGGDLPLDHHLCDGLRRVCAARLRGGSARLPVEAIRRRALRSCFGSRQGQARALHAAATATARSDSWSKAGARCCS